MLRRLKKLVVLSAMATTLSLLASPTVVTKSNKPGNLVSDSPTMKAWLTKMPGAFRQIRAANADVKITNIDVKWKQTNIVHPVKIAAKSKRKKSPTATATSYTCELRLTIEYQDSASGEEAPDLIATPTPITVNSRCDSFLAKNNLIPTQEYGT